MELTHENNTAEAADPRAIVTGTLVPKAPIWDNDPTRDVSRRQRLMRVTLLVLATISLVILALAAVFVFRALG